MRRGFGYARLRRLLIVRRTEKRRTSDPYSSGLLRPLHIHRAIVRLRTAVASRAAGRVRAFRSRAQQREKSKTIRLLRPSGSFGSGPRRWRGNQGSRPAARCGRSISRRWAQCWFDEQSGHHPSSLSPPWCRASSSWRPTVGRRRAALRVIRNGFALANMLSGEGSFEGPSNSALEPSRPPSCAIMLPRRAAQRER